MSRIDALIADLCPDGVKYRGLGEVGEFIRGNGLQKSDLTDAGVGAIHYGQVHTIYGVWTDTTRSFVTEQMARKLRKARSGDLVIATTSEDDAAVAKAVAWVGEGEVAVSSDAYIYSHSLEPKYVSYFFQTDHFQSQKTRHITGTKVRRISGESLAKIKIPVPPLEIQKEIVVILDKFTKLEAELEAELEARRVQYRHYRDQLLSFAAAGSGQRAAGIRWATLGDVASYSRSRIGASSLDEDSYIGVDNLLPDMRGRTKSNYVPTEGSAIGYQSGDILIGNIRPYLKKIWLADSSGGTNQDVLVVRLNSESLDEIGHRFLFHLLASDQFFAFNMQYAKGAKMPRGDKDSIMTFEIPIPPLAEQERIVAILDRFDMLVNDLSSGLPAEIVARRRQYEHYRDRLLTFPEAA